MENPYASSNVESGSRLEVALNRFRTKGIGFYIVSAIASPFIFMYLTMTNAPKEAPVLIWIAAYFAALIPCNFYLALKLVFDARNWRKECPASSTLQFSESFRQACERTQRRRLVRASYFFVFGLSVWVIANWEQPCGVWIEERMARGHPADWALICIPWSVLFDFPCWLLCTLVDIVLWLPLIRFEARAES